MSSPIAFPPGPTWVIVNADQPLNLPLLGQFQPMIEDQRGEPIWQQKAGIAGGLPWLKHVGTNLGHFSFEFLVMGLTVIDPYPLIAWNLLQELASVDSTLGRPPRIWFNHGLFLVEGFITNIPDAPIMYWDGGIINSRIIRQIGPIRVTVTRIPKSPTEISIGTNYVTQTEETNYEELAKMQYGDPRYAQSVALYNQGVKRSQTIELPRKQNTRLSRTVEVAPYLDDNPIDKRL